jgi:hypothetical protein
MSDEERDGETARPEYGASEETRPPAVGWFTVYAIAMALMYFCAIGLGTVLLVFAPGSTADEVLELRINGIVCIVVGIPCLAVFAVAPFLPRRRWVWIYDLVLICLGMTNCCCLPVCIPLLIFWIKPETKAWFGHPSARAG